MYPFTKTSGWECPRNETSWTIRSEIICNNTGNLVYHCLPTNYLNDTIEDCFIPEPIQPGFCAVYNSFIKSVYFNQQNPCTNLFPETCPNKVYQSNELYEWPSCLEINPDEKCYLAESTCPRIQRITTVAATSDPGTGGARKQSSYRVQVVMLIFTAMLIK
ncbi:uncharacterized protein LOC133197581 isoform X2 [Saccostrea echinata]|nr:uncharacterized protein LOC133197581 isoform X2 [Saccostrea echinata]